MDRATVMASRHVSIDILPVEAIQKYQADQYRCWPPPIFMIFITAAQVGFFAISTSTGASSGSSPQSSPAAGVVESVLMFRPDRKLEAWRLLSYMFVHAGWLHLIFNVVVQLILGVLLELVHGGFRIGLVYIAGIIAGSLGTSVLDSDLSLIGASSGAYALLAAHIANVALNYCQMECALLRIVSAVVVAVVDLSLAIWRRSIISNQPITDELPISCVAHLTGAFAGLTVGILVLKTFGSNPCGSSTVHQWVTWAALSAYLAFLLFCVVWSVFLYAKTNNPYEDEVSTSISRLRTRNTITQRYFAIS